MSEYELKCPMWDCSKMCVISKLGRISCSCGYRAPSIEHHKTIQRAVNLWGTRLHICSILVKVKMINTLDWLYQEYEYSIRAIFKAIGTNHEEG